VKLHHSVTSAFQVTGNFLNQKDEDGFQGQRPLTKVISPKSNHFQGTS